MLLKKCFIKTKKHILNHPYVYFIFLPWLLCCIYICGLKTHLYEVSSRILVHNNADNQNITVNLGFLGKSSGNSNESQKSYLTREFIQSRDMFLLLDKELRLKKHYQSKKIDYISRLPRLAKEKDVLEYFQNKIAVTYDVNTQEIGVRVQGFSPEYTYKLSKAIIRNVQEFNNQLSNNIKKERLRFSEMQLQLAKRRLDDIEKKILEFQHKNKIFDPNEQLALLSKIILKLHSSLVEKQTQLINYKTYLTPSSPNIMATQKEIKAIKAQINTLKLNMLGDSDTALNETNKKFQHLKLIQKFAMDEYSVAQKAFDMDKIEYAKQKELVLEVLSPTLPDDYTYPNITLDLFLILVTLFLVYYMFKMIEIMIREHTD